MILILNKQQASEPGEHGDDGRLSKCKQPVTNATLARGDVYFHPEESAEMT